jgi:hypothetical protein
MPTPLGARMRRSKTGISSRAQVRVRDGWRGQVLQLEVSVNDPWSSATATARAGRPCLVPWRTHATLDIPASHSRRTSTAMHSLRGLALLAAAATAAADNWCVNRPGPSGLGGGTGTEPRCRPFRAATSALVEIAGLLTRVVREHTNRLLAIWRIAPSCPQFLRVMRPSAPCSPPHLAPTNLFHIPPHPRAGPS